MVRKATLLTQGLLKIEDGLFEVSEDYTKPQNIMKVLQSSKTFPILKNEKTKNKSRKRVTLTISEQQFICYDQKDGSALHSEFWN